MRGLYARVNFKQAWNISKGFYAALIAMYNVFKKNHEKMLIYPLIDLAFHAMEKIAFSLLYVKKGVYVGKHSQIRKDFIKGFKGFSMFKEMVENYGDIMDAKDSLLYEFEELILEEQLDFYVKCIKNFKTQAEHYLVNKGVRL